MLLLTAMFLIFLVLGSYCFAVYQSLLKLLVWNFGKKRTKLGEDT